MYYKILRISPFWRPESDLEFLWDLDGEFVWRPLNLKINCLGNSSTRALLTDSNNESNSQGVYDLTEEIPEAFKLISRSEEII